MNKIKWYTKLIIHITFERINNILIKYNLRINRDVSPKVISVNKILLSRSFYYLSRNDAIHSYIPLEKVRIGPHPLKLCHSGHINYWGLRLIKDIQNGREREKMLEWLYNDYCKAMAKTKLSYPDVFGTSGQNNRGLNNLPSWAKIFPWESHPTDISSIIRMANFSIWLENSKRGGPKLDGYNGGGHYPLVNKKRAAFEVKLLLKLLKSVEKYGFKSNESIDPIGAIILNNGNNWCWIVNGGIHRCSVLSFLGYNEVPVYVKKVVMKDDLEFWPNVRNGLFQKECASKIFDNIMKGNGFSKHNEFIEKKMLS